MDKKMIDALRIVGMCCSKNEDTQNLGIELAFSQNVPLEVLVLVQKVDNERKKKFEENFSKSQLKSLGQEKINNYRIIEDLSASSFWEAEFKSIVLLGQKDRIEEILESKEHVANNPLKYVLQEFYKRLNIDNL